MVAALKRFPKLRLVISEMKANSRNRAHSPFAYTASSKKTIRYTIPIFGILCANIFLTFRRAVFPKILCKLF